MRVASPKGERPLEPHFSARVFSRGRGTNVGIYHDVESNGIYHDAVRAARRRTAARQQLGKKQRQLQLNGGWVRSSGETMNDETIGPAEETRMFRLDADAMQTDNGVADNEVVTTDKGSVCRRDNACVRRRDDAGRSGLWECERHALGP